MKKSLRVRKQREYLCLYLNLKAVDFVVKKNFVCIVGGFFYYYCSNLSCIYSSLSFSWCAGVKWCSSLAQSPRIAGLRVASAWHWSPGKAPSTQKPFARRLAFVRLAHALNRFYCHKSLLELCPLVLHAGFDFVILELLENSARLLLNTLE